MFGLTTDQLLIIAGALFAVSEALSMIPSINANGVFQLIFNALKKVLGK